MELSKNGKIKAKNAIVCNASKTLCIQFDSIPYKEYYPRTKTAKNVKILSENGTQERKRQWKTQKAIKNALRTSKNALRATERKKTDGNTPGLVKQLQNEKNAMQGIKKSRPRSKP